VSEIDTTSPLEALDEAEVIFDDQPISDHR
jgi:hypothetical protein